MTLIAAARRCLRRGYVAADDRGAPYRYRKAGRRVRVYGEPGDAQEDAGRERGRAVPRWEMRRERLSPRYTTRWDELAVVVA